MAKTVTAAKPRSSGVIYRAPIGTTLPTDATTTLASAFKTLGRLSEDGFTNSYERSSEDIREMGGSIVLTVQTETSDKFSFTLIDALDPDALKAAFGDTKVSGTLAAGIAVTVDGSEPEEAVWVLETIMRDGALQRIVIPDGKVSEMEEIAYRRNEAVGYGLTITALLDETAGFNHKTYIVKSATSGTSGTSN